MASVTVMEATVLTGRSRNAINEATLDGRLSSFKGDKGEKRIDVSELARVYTLVVPYEDLKAKQSSTRSELLDLAEQSPDALIEITELRGQVKALKEGLESSRIERDRERRDFENQIEFLRDNLEREQKNHDQSLKLLTFEREQGATNREAENARIAALAETVEKLSRQQRQILREVREPKTIWSRLFPRKPATSKAG